MYRLGNLLQDIIERRDKLVTGGFTTKFSFSNSAIKWAETFETFKTETALRGQVRHQGTAENYPALPEILTGSEPCSLIEPIFISGHILGTDFLKISVRDENRLC